MVIGDDWADPLANSQSSALRVAGPLRDSGRRRPDERWSEWFSGLQVTSIGSETILLGTLPDQSALHGVLDQICRLGLSVIAVRRPPREENREKP